MNDTTIVGRETEAISELLSNSRDYMTLAQIAKAVGAPEAATRAAIRGLAQAGQIDPIPASSGRPARYGWMHSAPATSVPVSSDSTPAEPPPVREEFRAAVVAATAQACAGSCGSCAASGSDQPAPEAELAAPEAQAAPAVRWIVEYGKTKRTTRSHARAQLLALAAIRRGAARADVFALVPAGGARRDAAWIE